MTREKGRRMSRTCLILVDVQNDFCEDGALPVKGASDILPTLNELQSRYDIVVATQDWHPEGHLSFASSHEGKQPMDVINLEGVEQVLWPDHCVQSSKGADFRGGLDLRNVRTIVRKGMDPSVDSYSGFRDNLSTTDTGLAGLLRELGVVEVHLGGLATDFCVYFTGMDALERGFQASILLDACRGLDHPRGSLEEKLDIFRRSGGKVILSRNVLS